MVHRTMGSKRLQPAGSDIRDRQPNVRWDVVIERNGSDTKTTPSRRLSRFFSRRPRAVWIALILILAGLGLWAFLAWRSRTTAGNQNQTFRLVRATRGPIEVTVTGTGTVKPARRWELTARAPAEVKNVLVKTGEAVKAGQVLVQLDTEDASLKLQDAELQLEEAQATLSELESKLASLAVKSDAEGSLTTLSVKEGQSVPENYLVGTVTSSKMEVKAYFNASQVQNIQPGQEAQVFFPSFLSTVTGVVTHVSETGKADPGGAVLYPVTIEIENKGALMPGMLATVQVNTPAGVMQAPQNTSETSNVVQEIRTKASGTVKRVLASEGDRVRAGDVVLELENETLARQVESQRLKVKQAQAQLSSAQDGLAACTITAPADGTVLDVKVSQGDRVGAGTVVAVVADLSAMDVTLPVDEIDVGKVKVGQPATVTSDALPGKQLHGKVSAISLEGKTSGGVATYDARVTVEGETGLLSGMTCDVRITTASSENALLLPIEALQPREGGYVVWVVSELPANTGTQTQFRRGANTAVSRTILSQAKAVPVQVGLMNSTQAEILSGLNEGDVVVVFVQNSGQSEMTRQFFRPGAGTGGLRVVPR